MGRPTVHTQPGTARSQGAAKGKAACCNDGQHTDVPSEGTSTLCTSLQGCEKREGLLFGSSFPSPLC